MQKKLAIGLFVLMGFLQYDFWFWPDIEPLVMGWMPVGFFYQAFYTLALVPVSIWGYRVLWDARDDEITN